MKRYTYVLLALAAMATAAQAKEWGEMNGLERVAYTRSYVARNHLTCPEVPDKFKKLGAQEQFLMKYGWWMVRAGVWMYCLKGADTVRTASAKRKPHYVPLPLPRPTIEAMAAAPQISLIDERWPEKEFKPWPSLVLARWNFPLTQPVVPGP